MDLESPIDSPREAAKSKKNEREPINNPKEKGVISTKKPERRLKPHEKVAVDYTKDLFAAQEETFDQAPLVIVVQGSKNSGKTTLIQSLIKYYTRQKVNKVTGTITIRSNKNQRLTFIECPNDINSMIDYAKIADLALLLIDGSLGFEMETFEFLSILKSHGFPNVMGVLTHLDFFKENKQLRKTKKKLKKRFTYETGDDYKLFYLSGLKNGLYPQMEILNLARFISIIKYKPIDWKLSHPFILIDRFEDENPAPKQDEDECNLAFYGYIRGSSYRDNKKIHIIGLGDYPLDSIEIIEDPCPPLQKSKGKGAKPGPIIPIVEKVFEEDKGIMEEEPKETKEEKKNNKRRTLKQNERIIYAPYADLNTVNFDKTGGYITIPEEHVVFTKLEKPTKREKLMEILAEEENEQEKPENSMENEENLEEGVKMVRDLHTLQRNLNDNLHQNKEEVELFDNFTLENPQESGPNIEERALIDFKTRKNLLTTLKNTTVSLEALGVESNKCFNLQENLFVDDISQLIYGSSELKKFNAFDCSRFEAPNLASPEHYISLNLKSFFLTGALEEEISNEQEENAGKPQENQEITQENQLKTEIKEPDTAIEAFFQRDLGVYKRGSYVKLHIKGIKYRFYRNFSHENPLIVTRINPAEDNFGFLKLRMKKHRWYGNLLKSNDPVIFSIGWRRYQSLPIYCVQDPNDRYRFLKYTPNYDFCYAFTYGPYVPQLTGALCIQTLSNNLAKFRIAGIGQVLELSPTCQIMKKLKLIGEPFKIYKNTAFIKGMFNSNLEVTKFEGATIRTVSGIRGQVKKPVPYAQEGCFRATFEDKILLSDLVFCRTWYGVSPEKFFNPIILFDRVRLMKNTWELRQMKKIAIEANEDSKYKDVQRVNKVFNPLRIPKKLEENLPFKAKEKLKRVSLKEKLEKMEYMKPLKQLSNEHEKQIYALMQRLNTIKNEKRKLKQEKRQETERIREKIKAKEEKQHKLAEKDAKKEKFGKKARKSFHKS